MPEQTPEGMVRAYEDAFNDEDLDALMAFYKPGATPVPSRVRYDDMAAGERHAEGPRSHLFTVRLWKEEAADWSEYRGSVRDVVGGAFRNFRDWQDLAAFMIARLEEDEPGHRDRRAR